MQPETMTKEEGSRTAEAQPRCTPATGSDVPTFKLYKYNPRRRARGVEAAEVEVTWPNGEKELLWMTQKDIRENLKQFGESAGLRDALKAYRQNDQ